MEEPQEVSEEVTRKVKERMPKFQQWRNKKVGELSDDFREKAEDVADEIRREGFWIEAESLYDLHVIHGLSLEEIKEDLTSSVEQALGEKDDE